MVTGAAAAELVAVQFNELVAAQFDEPVGDINWMSLVKTSADFERSVDNSLITPEVVAARLHDLQTSCNLSQPLLACGACDDWHLAGILEFRVLFVDDPRLAELLRDALAHKEDGFPRRLQRAEY
jgi:hypothetical protein